MTADDAGDEGDSGERHSMFAVTKMEMERLFVQNFGLEHRALYHRRITNGGSASIAAFRRKVLSGGVAAIQPQLRMR